MLREALKNLAMDLQNLNRTYVIKIIYFFLNQVNL